MTAMGCTSSTFKSGAMTLHRQWNGDFSNMRVRLDADSNAQPSRHHIKWRTHIRTGDVLDFKVEFRRSHDCIGLHIVDIQAWRNDVATAVEWWSPSEQQRQWQMNSLHGALERES